MTRPHKSKKSNEEREEEGLQLDEATCNICFNIFIEPVTLGCSHTLCLQCYSSTLEHNSAHCPFCRKRIYNVRKNAKENRLVNFELWTKIKQQWPGILDAKQGGDYVVNATQKSSHKNGSNNTIINKGGEGSERGGREEQSSNSEDSDIIAKQIKNDKKLAKKLGSCERSPYQLRGRVTK